MTYGLTPDTQFHKFLLAVGPGGNGKGVFVQVLEALVGSENVSDVGLGAFGKDFHLGATIGRLVNLAPEVSKDERPDEGVFKAFIAGDRIQVNRKYRDPISVKPTARVVTTLNLRPDWDDRSEAIWRRMLLVNFDVTIPEERQDRGLAAHIIRDELSGVFLWALEGLARLIKNGSFTISEDSRGAVADYRREVNPTQAFLVECCSMEPGASISADSLYGLYADQCRRWGFQPVGKGAFGHEVRHAFPGVARRQRRIEGKRPWFLIRIKCSGSNDSAQPGEQAA